MEKIELPIVRNFEENKKQKESRKASLSNEIYRYYAFINQANNPNEAIAITYFIKKHIEGQLGTDRVNESEVDFFYDKPNNLLFIYLKRFDSKFKVKILPKMISLVDLDQDDKSIFEIVTGEDGIFCTLEKGSQVITKYISGKIFGIKYFQNGLRTYQENVQFELENSKKIWLELKGMNSSYLFEINKKPNQNNVLEYLPEIFAVLEYEDNKKEKLTV